MYPPDLAVEGNQQRFRHAMVTAGVPENDADKILQDSVQNAERGTAVAERFNAVRSFLDTQADGLKLYLEYVVQDTGVL